MSTAILILGSFSASQLDGAKFFFASTVKLLDRKGREKSITSARLGVGFTPNITSILFDCRSRMALPQVDSRISSSTSSWVARSLAMSTQKPLHFPVGRSLW